MDRLKSLIDSEAHEEILKLEGDVYNQHKAIAAIHLGRFDDALNYVEKGSFEHAYVLYRQKKFKKALRILREKEDEKSDILKSQCLYNMGYYSDAYNLLSRHGSSDEYAVNLAAMESLAYLNAKNRSRPSIFATKNTSSVNVLSPPIFRDVSCQLEYDYNNLFKLVEDEEEFIKALEELEGKYKIKNSCIRAQLNNLRGEDIQNPSERQKETIRFNSGEKGAIKNPVHFQANFVENPLSEYSIFNKYQHIKGDVQRGSKTTFCEVIPVQYCYSDKLRLLHALTCYKNNKGHRMVEHIKKIIEPCEDSPEKDLIIALITKITNSEDRKKVVRALELFDNSN